MKDTIIPKWLRLDSLILTIVYIVISILLVGNADEMVLFILPEGFAILLAGLIVELINSKSFGQGFRRFLIYLILLGTCLILLMFPFCAALFMNDTQLPELALFHSELADQMYVYLNTKGSLLDVFAMPFVIIPAKAWLIVIIAFVPFIFRRWKQGSMFKGEGQVPLELKEIAFLTLGYLISILPAFLLGMAIKGSFPFVLIIGMRLFAELFAYKNEHPKEADKTDIAK